MKTASLTVALTALVVLAASSTEATRVGAGAQVSLATSSMAEVQKVTEAPPAKEDKDMESEAEIKEKARKMTEECKKQAERDHKLALNRLAGTYKAAIEHCITVNKPRCPAARRNCKAFGIPLPGFVSALYPESMVKGWCKGDFCEQYGSCSVRCLAWRGVVWRARSSGVGMEVRVGDAFTQRERGGVHVSLPLCPALSGCRSPVLSCRALAALPLLDCNTL